MKKHLLSVFLLMISIAVAMAQQRTISGVVTDADSGDPLIGANVLVKGTTLGTVTDFDGAYTIEAATDDVLQITYVGYPDQEVNVGPESILNISMGAGQVLDELVVTALGISREKKALGYAVQEIQGDELAATLEPNVTNALQGKLAGVLVTSSSGAPGAGANILIRGLSSLDPSGSNQPLIVVDGIPISNQTIAGNQLPSTGSNSPGSSEQASFTNRLADINSADIESLNVLKGASATALYGLRGANGVIVITTKKGQQGKPQIGLTTSYGVMDIAKAPDYQTTYREGRFGRLRFRSNGNPLRFQSFGPKVYEGVTPVYDPIDDLFVQGNKADVSLSVSGGTEAAQYYTSFGYSNTEGIIPFSDWSRMNVRLGGQLAASDKLSIGGSVNFSNSGGNKPHSGDKSIMSALSYHPTTFDVLDYINPDGTQRDYSDGIIDNPRYLAEYSTFEDDVNRIIGNLSFNYKFNSWLEADFKVGRDFYNDTRQRIVPPGLDVSSQTGGFIIEEDVNFSETNTLLFLRANRDLTPDLNANFTLGHNMSSIRTDRTNTRGERFTLPDFYDLSNTSVAFIGKDDSKKRIVGVMVLLNLAYKDYLYLDITGRNDWSSSLPKENRSFFYPSVSLSFIPSELTDMGPIDFMKLRASWAEVAKDAGPHLIGATYVAASNFPFDGTNGFAQSSVAGDNNLKPETTTGVELGVDLRFLNNRLGLDLTYYQQNSKDQIIPVPVSNSTGLSRFITNAGEIKNTGVEVLLTATPLRGQKFSWDASLNWSTNKGEVISIVDGVDEIQFFRGGFGNITSKMVPGGQVGDLYGYNFLKTPEGDLIIGSNGFPIINTDSVVLVGNAMPDWTAGLTNTFTYGGLGLSFLLEWREGGDIYDMGLRNSIRNGVLGMTDRRYEEVTFKGMVDNGDGTYSPNTQAVEITGESLYRSSTRYNRAADVILEDASWFRLRRVSLFYELPSAIFEKMNVIRGAKITLTGTNLFINTPFRGYDPETNYLGSGSNVYGFTGLQNPGVRSYTATLNLSF